MKKHSIFTLIVELVFLVGACSKNDDLKPLPEDKYNFTSRTAVVMEISVSQNNSYQVKEFTLDPSELSAAFGDSIPSDLMFYAIDSNNVKHVGVDEYTSEYGFYFTKSGNVCMPSAKGCALFVEYYGIKSGETNPTIGIGQYPEACKVGDTMTVQIGLADTITGQPYQLKITIKAPGEWATYFENSDSLTYTVYETVNTEYKALKVFVDETALCKKLGVASSTKIVTGIINKTITFVGINADGSSYPNYTANSYGHWFDASGNVCSWRATNCSIYSEWYGETPISFSIGQFPSGIAAGNKFTIRQAFVSGSKTVILTFKVRIVDEITDYLGPDETKK